MTAGAETTRLCTRRTVADVGSVDDSSTCCYLHCFVCWQLAEVDEWMTLVTVEPARRVHVVLVVVAWQCRRQGRIRGADGGSQRAEIGPLVKTKLHSSLGGLYVAVLGAVGLIPLSEVYAVVARRDADVVSASNMLAQLDAFVTCRHGLCAGAYAVDVPTKSGPSVTRNIHK